MKKYLVTGLAAVAISGMFTSCTHDTDGGNGNTNLGVVETYEKAFISRFGTPSADADWGFGPTTAQAGTRTGNMDGKTPVAQTSTGINANANEWADKADAPHGHGGWLVPPALTEPQKEVVRKYFQANPKLEYKDPHFANFFVQQVYKGGTNKPETGNKETNKGADGTSYSSDNMNLLTVGYNEQHINNFNAGSYSGANNSHYDGMTGIVNNDGTVNVLDNGYTVNQFADHHHPDQIMLMVNIDDTGCMGYHNTGCSLQRNDKAALVGWETIRKWARDEKIYTEDILNDGWNRSFVGFDFALYSLDESYVKDGNGDNIYAKMSDGQNGGLQYVWDGENVSVKGIEGIPNMDLTSKFTELWNSSESKTVNSDGTITYNAAQWGGLEMPLHAAIDFGKYESLVIEFAEATPFKTQWYIEYGTDTYSWNSNSKFEIDADITEFELNFASKYMSNLNFIYKVALQATEAGTLKIRSIYLKGREGEPGFGNYLLVDGKKVPFLKTNMNMYGGILYGGKDEALSDGEMKINKDGKECFNMKKIQDLVHDGYLPVKDKNLRTWVKWEFGDGYFSDWIVTLTEAKRNDEETSPDVSTLRVIAEDLGDQSLNENSDFDFNDVVFDVTWKSENEVEIEILAAGGTLPLTVGWDGTTGNYRDYEVHNLLGYSETMIINTNSNVGSHIENVPSVKRTLNGTFRKDHFAEDVRDNIPVKVRKSGVWYDIEADKGKVAGKLAVAKDYDWCDERVDVDDWWMDNDKKGLFIKYTQAPATLTKYWYRQAKYRRLQNKEIIEVQY